MPPKDYYSKVTGVKCLVTGKFIEWDADHYAQFRSIFGYSTEAGRMIDAMPPVRFDRAKADKLGDQCVARLEGV